jgi:hypothetical protein
VSTTDLAPNPVKDYPSTSKTGLLRPYQTGR